MCVLEGREGAEGGWVLMSICVRYLLLLSGVSVNISALDVHLVCSSLISGHPRVCCSLPFQRTLTLSKQPCQKKITFVLPRISKLLSLKGEIKAQFTTLQVVRFRIQTTAQMIKRMFTPFVLIKLLGIFYLRCSEL